MKIPVLCTLIITAMLTNTTLAKTPLSYKIDDLEYQPYQIMTDDEMASTTGKAIPVLLAPILWGALQGASVNLSLYFAEAAVSGKQPTFKQAFIEAATGAGLGAATGPVNLNIFLKGETAALFIGGLKGTYLGNGKNKTGPAFDSVPTKQDLDRVLNDKNWSDQHFKKIMGPIIQTYLKKHWMTPSHGRISPRKNVQTAINNMEELCIIILVLCTYLFLLYGLLYLRFCREKMISFILFMPFFAHL